MPPTGRDAFVGAYKASTAPVLFIPGCLPANLRVLHGHENRTRWRDFLSNDLESRHTPNGVTIDFVRMAMNEVFNGHQYNELGKMIPRRRCRRVFTQGMGYYKRRAAESLEVQRDGAEGALGN